MIVTSRQRRLAMLPLLAAGAILALGAAGAARPAAKEGGAFIVTLGRDTLAMESYVRIDSVLTGTSVVHNARGTLNRKYTLTLDRAGNLARYEVLVYPAGVTTGAPLLHSYIVPAGNAMHEVIHNASGEHILHIVTGPATLPFMDMGFGMWEAVVMRAVRSGKDEISVPMLFIGDSTVYTTTVKRRGDSVFIQSEYGAARAKIDAQGHILGYDAPGSTEQVVVQRVASVDLAAFEKASMAKPALVLSPTDTVRANAGAAKLTVIYSRPSMRGRVIFGAVVPWNTVWRTGANAATTFITDKDLTIGGTTVPAGEYTLFTLPNPGGWKLIISKKTKEWGTDYDATQDLARIDMTVASLPAPVEQCTIAIVPQGAGTTLSVSWERTSASVSIQAK